ncbi:MAG: chemotaxis-specific protein-glutamate methyltransferase CheB [Candidatus Ozemobacteraceae bacterium]
MRIAIVNDLLIAVEALRRVIQHRPTPSNPSQPGASDHLYVLDPTPHTIAWIARNGAEAVEKCAADVPDLILMDLLMPVMNGVEATRRIMRETPCAILIVTATVEGNMSLVFEAMGYGALDTVNTPVLKPSGEPTGAIDLLAKIDVIGRLIGKAGNMRRKTVVPHNLPGSEQPSPPLLLIGASTGGPTAIAELLSGLPKPSPIAIVIVQHIDELFAADLASWLAGRTGLMVHTAHPGARPCREVVLLAATNDHLVMKQDGRLFYENEPSEAFYRPSVDVFFRSVAAAGPPPGAAVLLTGMGRDGAEGLLELHIAGWKTFAQDKETSVVFGMPHAAIEIGAVAVGMSPANIAEKLTTWCFGSRS